jgi:hypothetical protein
MLWHFAHTLVAFLIENYKIAGAVAAGILASYKGWQSGILHPLLDLKVSGRLIWDGNRRCLVSSMEANNVHLPMVRLDYCALRVSSRANSADDSDSERAWPPLTTVQVFDGHDKVWSREVIRDEKLLLVPENEQVFRLEFRIGRKQGWYQRPLNFLSRVPRLRRFAPGHASWYAVAIVEEVGGESEVNREGNHPSGTRANGRRNEGVEGSDQEDEGQD